MTKQTEKKLPTRVSALAMRFADLLIGDRFCFINEHGRNPSTLSEPFIKTGSDSYRGESGTLASNQHDKQLRQRKVYRLAPSESERKEKAD